MKKHLNLPLSKEDASVLRAGDSVLLSGIVYTARDAAHKRLVEMIENNQALPFNIENAAIYYVGPSPSVGDAVLGSAGPTTSSRCDKFTPALLQKGMTVMIGKGRRSDLVKEEIIHHRAVYLAATGGAGALLSRCIISAKVIAFEDLGPEAIRELQIENFPAFVVNDCYGGDYYETARQEYLNYVNQ